VCLTSDQQAAFIGFDIWPIKAAAQVGRRVKHICRKKYPLTISDERVSLSHINLMTLGLIPDF
jgi:hypothetical protein